MSGSEDGSADEARFYEPEGVALDQNGAAFVSDTRNHTIRRVAADGSVTTFAGAAGLPGAAEGARNKASFRFPAGVAVDGGGNLLIADRGNHVIRKISMAGVVSTLVGLAGVAGHADGPLSEARLNSPSAIAVRRDGAVVIADTGNRTIRVVTANGVVSTLAGSRGQAGHADGNGDSARFGDLHGIVADDSGDVFVTDSYTSGSSRLPLVITSIRRVTPAGEVSTIARWHIFEQTRFNPRGIAINAAGRILFGSSGQVAQIERDGSGLMVLAESSQTAPLSLVSGVAADRAGAIFLVDSGTHSIRKIGPGGTDRTVGGALRGPAAVDGPGHAARFNAPRGLAADAAGNVFVADSGNHIIRRINPAGIVTTIAGAAGVAGSQDGAGAQARFSRPAGLAIDTDGILYVADTGNSQIRKISRDGVVSTLAGAPHRVETDSRFVDGAGRSARFHAPEALAVNAAGEVFVADTWNHAVRKITREGVVTTPFAKAKISSGSYPLFENPRDIAIDTHGNLYVVHAYPPILKIGPNLATTQIAAQTPALLAGLTGVAVDRSGNIFVTTRTGIRKIDSAGQVSPVAGDTFGAGVLSHYPTVAPAPAGSTLGRYWVPGSTDGVGQTARFSAPTALVITPQGEIFCSDTGNNTVRKGVVAADPSRLTNTSILAALSGEEDSITIGAKLGGAGTSGEKSLLLRAAGNSLRRFDIENPLADPKLESFDGSVAAGFNDEWDGTSAMREAFARVGAFPFDGDDSREPALLQTFRARSVAMRVRGNQAAGGTVLAELYDAERFRPLHPRLTNVSGLARLEAELNVGFMVGGTGAKTLLIRAVGPTLGAFFGIEHALDDPQLELFDAAGRLIARNESWSDAAHSLVLLDAFEQTGAFRLLGASLDAACVVTVEPGGYTIRVRPGIGKPAGMVLVEVYEMP